MPFTMMAIPLRYIATDEGHVRQGIIMTKDEILGIFRTCQNNCKIVYVSMLLLSHDDTTDFFKDLHDRLSIPKAYKNEDILPILYDKEVLKIALSQLYDTVHIAALRDLFELTKIYCSETGQEELLKKQPWYQFWRTIRNCFSHDFTFRFRDYDKKKLPVFWDGFTIDATLDGTKLTHGQFSREQFWKFLSNVSSFIKNDLA